jgi:hypothetical protein
MSYFVYVPTILPASKVIPSRPTKPPPQKKHKHTQTQNCPLQPSDARSVCLAPVFFQPPTHHMIRHNTTGPRTPILEWEGGKKKRKTPIANEIRASRKDLSLSLPRTSSPREETTMQPRLGALNSNSFQTIFCKTVNQYNETIFFVNGVPAAQESSDSRSAMQKLFASNEIDRARRQLEYSRSASISLCLRRAATDVSGLRSP